ncbi:exocyst complex component EXO70B1-like [Phoenix dactylifera]|uniref:Exocyst subunit Exo70 family protein n=1 Tax=Phoenix dactylifera TaxID=42345 RepID=A0A8B7MT33_PHODC|nr:exocyst complex component EXO70B1-like [Phoenix dactylifera]
MMDRSGGAMPSPAADGNLEEAEREIMRWDLASTTARIFDGGDRSDAERFLRAVDEICRFIKKPIDVGSPRRSSSSSSSSAENGIKIAMARLEEEFQNIVVSRVNEFEIESLVDLSSLSMSSSMSVEEDRAGDLSDSEGCDEGSLLASGSEGSSLGHRRKSSSCRSTRSIREIDLLPEDAIADLRSIAERMIAAGYGRECVQVYSSARKAAVDLCFRQLGVEKLSIGDVQRLGWDALEAKIRRWIRAARACVRIVFASERRLCECVFDDLGGVPGGDDAPFTEAVKGAAIQLFGFAEAISISRRSPEKLFKILDLHDAISDLLPDIAAVFCSKSCESIYTQAAEILSRLAEAVRGILSELENAVLRDPSKIPVPGGTIHPLTRYVMNYISLISDYKQTLVELILTKPSVSSRFSGDDPDAGGPEVDFPEPENKSPLAFHLIWIIVILQDNLENKANLYKDSSLSHLFLMNNVHYIVQKAKGSPELRELIGDGYLRKLTAKFRQSATSYQRATWVGILYYLRDEGVHVSGSFSSGVSKSTLRERFRAFNAAFDEVHRTQAAWLVPDTQLREELRISISERLFPAYRSFLGRFRHHLENDRHPEMYIKYSVEDLEAALSDFFEGCTPSPLNRRRSH